MNFDFDCIVVGGGAAGLSAALVLGRARRRTLVVDAGRQSNLAAHGIGGLLGHNERPPADLYAAGRAEILAHPSVQFTQDEVATASRDAVGFLVTLAGGEHHRTRRLLLATGMDYRYDPVPGVEQFWGESVFHCPFCHGWEVRERPLAVLDSDPDAGLHRALLLRGWSDDVTLLTNGPSDLGEERRSRLAGAKVAIDERPVAKLVGEGRALQVVTFADGAQRSVGGILIPVTLHQRSDLAATLGADFAPAGPVSAETLLVDGMGSTTAPGLFAAGDTGAAMPSIAGAIAGGSLAAAGIMGSLMLEH